MARRLELQISQQPDDFTCGATCLQAVYRYWDDPAQLTEVIATVKHLAEGGTVGVHLGSHALRRGYEATIYTYNLQLFDPTWFADGRDLVACLEKQMHAKDDPKLAEVSLAYIEFLKLGGRVRYMDLTARLLRRYLKRDIPLIVGLSATYLYRNAREYGDDSVADDIRGLPVGHFVVLSGYDIPTRRAVIADPYGENPTGHHHYEVDIYRLICSILLGVLTYDANLLVIEKAQ